MTKKKNNKAKRRITLSFLILFFIIIGIALTLPNYISQISSKYREKRELDKYLVELSKEEKTLEKEVLQLSDSSYIAKIARQKYLLSKDGEIIVKIDDDETDEKNKEETGKIILTNENVIISIGILGILIITFLRRRKRTQK